MVVVGEEVRVGEGDTQTHRHAGHTRIYAYIPYLIPAEHVGLGAVPEAQLVHVD